MRKLDRRGFTLVEIMIVVAIIGLLAAIAIPNYMAARATAAENACEATLRQITAAIEMFHIDNAGAEPATLGDLDGYFRGGTPTVCPGDATQAYLYTAGEGVDCPVAGHDLP